MEPEPTGLAHTVPVPASATLPLQQIAIPEPTLVDVVLCDHQHTLALLDHFTVAAAAGNAHAMELLAGALALDLRLQLQAAADVVQPAIAALLASTPAAVSLEQAQDALEADILEVLTCRRERDWRRLAAAVQKMHQDFAGYVQQQEMGAVPLLVQHKSQVQLTALANQYHHVKRAATLLPHVNVMPGPAVPLGEAAPMDVAGGAAGQQQEEEEEEEGVPKVSFPDMIELPETQANEI